MSIISYSPVYVGYANIVYVHKFITKISAHAKPDRSTSVRKAHTGLMSAVNVLNDINIIHTASTKLAKRFIDEGKDRKPINILSEMLDDILDEAAEIYSIGFSGSYLGNSNIIQIIPVIADRER